MTQPIRIISSMATKQILADLLLHYSPGTGHTVTVESVGGVDAARRVRDGEPFEVVILASGAIEQLMNESKLLDGSHRNWVVSGVAVAVKSGAAHPDISSEAAVKRAVMTARTVGYSTGPSGVQLARLFEQWGIADALQGRIVTAPAGVPVATLIARGEVALGFQQLSELLNVPGIDLLGLLPKEIEIVTTFSGALAATCGNPDAAAAVLEFLCAPQHADIIKKHGMVPAGLL